MQGDVFVPYTGISGNNIENGIMTLDLVGSTNPGEENQTGTTVNVRWTYPGGIISKNSWGYLLNASGNTTVCTDEDVRKWIIGEKPSERANSIPPSCEYTIEDIETGNSNLLSDLNELMSRYMHDVLLAGQYNEFREYYAGCVFLV